MCQNSNENKILFKPHASFVSLVQLIKSNHEIQMKVHTEYLPSQYCTHGKTLLFAGHSIYVMSRDITAVCDFSI